MNKQEILGKLDAFTEKYVGNKKSVVIGASAALVLHGLREDTNHIDIAVSLGVMLNVGKDPHTIRNLGNGKDCMDLSSGISIHLYQGMSLDNYSTMPIHHNVLIHGYSVYSKPKLLRQYEDLWMRYNDEKYLKWIDVLEQNQ